MSLVKGNIDMMVEGNSVAEIADEAKVFLVNMTGLDENQVNITKVELDGPAAGNPNIDFEMPAAFAIAVQNAFLNGRDYLAEDDFQAAVQPIVR